VPALLEHQAERSNGGTLLVPVGTASAERPRPARAGPAPGRPRLDLAGVGQHGVDHLERHDLRQLAQMTTGEQAASDSDNTGARVMTDLADSGAPGTEDVS